MLARHWKLVLNLYYFLAGNDIRSNLYAGGRKFSIWHIIIWQIVNQLLQNYQGDKKQFLRFIGLLKSHSDGMQGHSICIHHDKDDWPSETNIKKLTYLTTLFFLCCYVIM